MNETPLFLRVSAFALPALLVMAIGLFAISAPRTANAQFDPNNLPVRGDAPELSNNAWLNSERPLRLADLRGQVVLLEFWTFDCINCIRTIPHVQSWHETYSEQGLTVIGVHFPEFSYERDLQNVWYAAQRLGITYPIALDNDGATWDAYGQRFWPTVHLIDKQGRLRYLTIGEGRYDVTAQAIEALLAEPYEAPLEAIPATPDYLVPTTVLNVRAGSGVDQALIGSVEPGMAFVIEDSRAGWYAIRYGDGQGWVSGEYVTVNP